MKGVRDARPELDIAGGTALGRQSAEKAIGGLSADDVAELDRQLDDYKRACDEGRKAEVSRADALWLLNELIYQRDHARARHSSDIIDIQRRCQVAAERFESRSP